MAVRRAPGQPAHTNALPLVFDIEFDEPVVDFPVGLNAGGIVFSGTASGLRYEVTGEKAAYQVTVRSIAQDGVLSLAVPAELSADLFGNVNTASTVDAVIHYDVTRPQCVIQSDEEGVMNEARMNIALAFSEPVYGLQDSALTLENATIARVGGQDGDAAYQFVVTPRSDGTTALRLPEDAVVDGVGNGNEASPVFSLIVDSTGPAVALSSFETPQASNSWLIRVHAVFTEPVYDFEMRDVAVEGGALVNFTAREDGVTFLFDVKPSAAQVRVAVPAGVARDVIGNPNSASEAFVREVDRERTTVRLTVMEDDVRPGAPVPVEVAFSEAVYGFDDTDLRVLRGLAHRVSGVDGDAVYRYLVAPTGSRSVEVRIGKGAAVDLAGNSNRGASVRFKTPPPAAREESGKAAPPLNLYN